MTCSSLPRGPKGKPILGHALSLSGDALAFLQHSAVEYGDLVPLRFVGKPILFVNQPEAIAQVLATNHQKVVKGISRRSDHILLGDGISLSEGSTWRRERRLIQPAFHRDRLAAYGEDMVLVVERAVNGWRAGETRDICVEMSNLTLAIVGKTLLDIDAQGDASDLVGAVTYAMACRDAHARSMSMLLPDGFPTPANLRSQSARRHIDAIVQSVIDRRRTTGDDRSDLLSTLLNARDEHGRALPDEHLRNEVRTILVGGHETVADLLSWTWYLLSQHPEVEAKLLAEFETAFGGRTPAASDLPCLPYAAMVISEVLRLYPPASVLTREAIADFEIDGYLVPRGTEIVMSPWVVQRDSRYFSDPERFNPDRWTDGLASRLPHYAYFPFGGGPRLCIGKSFATQETILVLAVIARRFHLDLVPGHPVVPDPIPTLHPKFGLPMVIQRRPLP